MKPAIRVILSILRIGALGFIGYSYVKGINKTKDANDTALRTIEIVEGSSTIDIAEALEKEGIINRAFDFRLFSRLRGYDGEYLAGTYSLSPSMDMETIAQVIMTGVVNIDFFTIPEGLTVRQIALRLHQNGRADYDKFMALASSSTFDYDFLPSDLPEGDERLAGFLFPDTYSFTEDVDEYAIINMMLSRFGDLYTPEMRARAKELGYTDREILTIASIIERETVLPEERALVSSVIYNRLNAGMNLEMCSTVQFILGEQKEFLTYEDTSIDDPYNTYIYAGLPPGPICCPGIESIKAALYPADTDYLFFVVSAELDGSMAFSSDYDQFLADKDAYYEAVGVD